MVRCNALFCFIIQTLAVINQQGDEDEWIYPQRKPTENQERQLIGRVAEIGMRVVFQNFVYCFRGKLTTSQREEMLGPPMCAAKMVMQNRAEKFHGILSRGE